MVTPIQVTTIPQTLNSTDTTGQSLVTQEEGVKPQTQIPEANLSTTNLETSGSIATQARLQGNKTTIASLAQALDVNQIANAQNLGIQVEIPADVEEALLRAIEHVENLRPGILKETKEAKRDPGYHITLIPPTHSTLLSENPQAVLDELAKLTSSSITTCGIGKLRKADPEDPEKDKVAYFAEVDSPALRKFREKFGLNPLGLHVTLGFINNDVHPKEGEKPKERCPYLSKEVNEVLGGIHWNGGPDVGTYDLKFNVNGIDLPAKPKPTVKPEAVKAEATKPQTQPLNPQQLEIIVQAIEAKLGPDKASLVREVVETLGENIDTGSLQKALGPKFGKDMGIVKTIVKEVVS